MTNLKEHQYEVTTTWTGNQGHNTRNYATYSRDHIIQITGKPDILGSSDPAFRGDATRHNPEDLFLSSLSSCHMLWYLHLCSVHHVEVVSYEDKATGIMEEQPDGSGSFTKVVLRPIVTVTKGSMVEKAHELHHAANQKCFIANSVNFKVEHESEIKVIDAEVG